MTDTTVTDRPATNPPRGPLQTLAKLVGTWTVTGPTSSGRVRYYWADDGSALIQHVDLTNDGERTTGIEHIRYDESSRTFPSRYRGSDGEILEYVYDITGDTLTIWFGDVGSPARFTGTFSPDGRTNDGEWTWPGGGYASTMTRTSD
jgi:hypothetical protein